LNPIIQTEVNRWSGTLARPDLEIEAKRLAVEAIESFSPTGGASLATHVSNRLKKLSRLSYTHQNVARLPEYQTLKFRTFADAQSKLTDKFGRDPTHTELADELCWSKPAVKSFQTSLRREFIESGDLPPYFDEEREDSGILDYVYHDLSPQQKKIFEHTTGYGGVKVLSNPELTKKLKLTQGQLSYQKRTLVNKFERLMSKKG
jgi:DNA-directed RNA polymerase specialized sigma subunit